MQGLASFPGVIQVVSCRYTRGLGCQPGFAILEMLPQSQLIPVNGTLTFSFNGLSITLPKCRADFGSTDYSINSGKSVFIKIFDRRWAWKWNEISGRYNVRNTDGSLDTDTEKTPQELATLLLEALGEQGFDVSNLPNDDRPFVDWEYDKPAPELDRLCEQYGCRVCLKIHTNKVVIVKLGEGQLLSTTNLFRLTENFDVAEKPDKLKLVGGWVRFQSKLKLQAVGQEKDGAIKPIDDLSYKPTDGWSGVSDETFAVVSDAEERKLAQDWIWKAYQIVSQSDGTQEVPEYGDIEDINNLKPIDAFLIETYEDANAVTLFRPAYVEGIWWNTDTQFNINQDAGTRYPGKFSIERENGIVRFTEEVYQLDAATRTEAELYLMCSYHARDPEKRHRIRYIQDKDLGGNNGTGPEIIKRQDIVYTVRATYDTTDPTQPLEPVNNQEQVESDAQSQLDAKAEEYKSFKAYDAGYNGLVQIELDGLTRQVTFSVSKDNGAETLVSVNCESDPYVPRYSQRKLKREGSNPRTKISRRPRFPR